MAIKLIAQKFDDIDETEPAEDTIEFSFDGKSYEIDLNAPNATEMRDWLAYYAKHGRAVSAKKVQRGPARKQSGRSHRGRSSAASHKNLNAKIRQWATDQGMAINARGRIPQTVVAAYQEAKQQH